MLAISELLLMLYFAATSGQLTTDVADNTAVSSGYYQHDVCQSLERTRSASQRLLRQVKDAVDNMSSVLMMTRATQGSQMMNAVNHGDRKQQLVSALTEQCIPLLIQQNLDGSNAFNRSWADFKAGFNDTRGNYWLGNELLSRLTTGGRYKLRFDLKGRGRGWYYAEYSSFLVTGEAENFKLYVTGYSGNAGRDAFSYHHGAAFTTYDRDNDPYNNAAKKNNCAVQTGGGFWHKTCAEVEVNTIRGAGGDFSWEGLPGGIALDASRIWLQCH